MRIVFVLITGIFIALLGVLFFYESRDKVWPQSIWKNHLGVTAFHEKNYDQAQSIFLDVLTANPFVAAVHGNLGLSYEFGKQMDKALSTLKKAQEYAISPEEKFIAAYNLGHYYQQKQDYEHSLQSYQIALNLNPTSKEIKTNIELMQQQQQQQQKQQQKDKEDQDKKEKEGEGEKKGQDQKENQGEENKDNKESKDDKEKEKEKEKDKDQDKENKDKDKDKDSKDKKKDPPKYKPNRKYEPRSFKGENLSEGDVKKILGELKQQEQKIRADYYQKDVKEKPHGKDW